MEKLQKSLILFVTSSSYCISSRTVISRGAGGSRLRSSYIKDTAFMLAHVLPFKCLRQRGCVSVVWDTDIWPDWFIWRRTANIKAESRLRRGNGQLHLELPALWQIGRRKSTTSLCLLRQWFTLSALSKMSLVTTSNHHWPHQVLVRTYDVICLEVMSELKWHCLTQRPLMSLGHVLPREEPTERAFRALLLCF